MLTKKKSQKKGDTLDDILAAVDRDELIDWLRHQPLIYRHETCVLVHAGIPHIWSLEKALNLASEVENMLQSNDCGDFLSAMYGNEPTIWSDNLHGMTRLRVITNYLTRMRICKTDGTLDVAFKSSPDTAPEGFKPWFSFYPKQQSGQHDIFFGHWAMLESKSYQKHFHALDSGCVWGNTLTVVRLADQQWFSCGCR